MPRVESESGAYRNGTPCVKYLPFSNFFSLVLMRHFHNHVNTKCFSQIRVSFTDLKIGRNPTEAVLPISLQVMYQDDHE